VTSRSFACRAHTRTPPANQDSAAAAGVGTAPLTVAATEETAETTTEAPGASVSRPVSTQLVVPAAESVLVAESRFAESETRESVSEPPVALAVVQDTTAVKLKTPPPGGARKVLEAGVYAALGARG